MSLQHLQIGEVAERTGLSLRTIRYYEEVGLIKPKCRTQGGYRLYTESDVARLNLVKRMKPVGFSLDEARDLLTVLDALTGAADVSAARPDAGEAGATGVDIGRADLVDRLTAYRAAADRRCTELREELETAEAFAADLRTEISRQRRVVGQRP